MQRWRMRRCGPSVISGRETVPKDNALGTEVPARRLAQIPQIVTPKHRANEQHVSIRTLALKSARRYPLALPRPVSGCGRPH